MQLFQETSLPPFVFICDPISLRTTTTVLHKTLLDGAPGLVHVHLDAVACFSQKLLFDTVLDKLPGLHPDERWNDSWDAFLHGLRHVHRADKDVRVVISVEHVDRLKPDTIVPLSRLRELVLSFFHLLCDQLSVLGQSQTNVTVVFLSQTQWQDVKPALGASPEPYYIDIKPLTKSGILPFPLLSFSSLIMGSRGDNDSVVQVHRNFRSSIVLQIHTLLPPLFQSALWTLYLHGLRRLLSLCSRYRRTCVCSRSVLASFCETAARIFRRCSADRGHASPTHTSIHTSRHPCARVALPSIDECSRLERRERRPA